MTTHVLTLSAGTSNVMTTSMTTAFLMALYLLHTYILLCTIATFQKAGTCLEAQQSMAKQPIKGCVSNHSRTCGESVSEKNQNKFESPRRNFDVG